jgi:centriolar protein POC1
MNSINNFNNYKPKKLSGHKSLVNDVAISPTGLLIASASSDCTVRLWSNSTEDDVNNTITSSNIFKHNSAPVKSVDISCDSKLLVTGSDDKTVKIIRISDKKLQATFQAHTNWVKCVRFSKDSRLIVSASDDKSVKLWDVNRKCLNSTLANVHNGVVNVVRFHPDNSSLATGCFDKRIRIFDIRSKQLVQVYEEHSRPVTCIDFHPNGFYMASTSFDETIKIFDLRNGDVLYTLTGHEGATTAVAFSKFGEILATGGTDSIVNMWTTNLDDECNENKFSYNKFPIECDYNSIPQSASDYRSEKSLQKMFNSETGLNYRNNMDTKDVNSNSQKDLNKSVNYENISEELSKVFERMVYQLELITTYFS